VVHLKMASAEAAVRVQAAPLDPLSFLKLTPDKNGVELSRGGTDSKETNCLEKYVLAAPSETDENFATEEQGATVRVSSCIWGTASTRGREKLQNVLRLVPALSPQSRCVDLCPTVTHPLTNISF